MRLRRAARFGWAHHWAGDNGTKGLLHRSAASVAVMFDGEDAPQTASIRRQRPAEGEARVDGDETFDAAYVHRGPARPSSVTRDAPA
jgi:hypothetical protein